MPPSATRRCARRHLGSIGLIGSRRSGPVPREAGRRRATTPDAIDRITSRSGCPGWPARIRRRSRSASPPPCCRPSSARPRRRRCPSRADAEPTATTSMTLFRGTVPRHPGRSVRGRRRLRAEADGGLLVRDGVIVERGRFADAAAQPPGRGGRRPDRRPAAARVRRHPRALPAGPGHRRAGHAAARLARAVRAARGGRLADADYAARRRRASSSTGWSAAGTTTALVFGAHFAPADGRAVRAGRATRPADHRRAGASATGSCGRRPAHARRTAAYDEGRALAERWHGAGAAALRRHPAVLAVRAPTTMLDVVRRLHARTSTVVVHLAHQREPRRGRGRRRAVPGDRATTSTPTTGTAWSTAAASSRTTCTPPTAELDAAGPRPAPSVAHCPTSNSALGSGLFPLREHVEHGVRVALGSDVGAGTGFSLLKEGLQAYFMQQLLGEAACR